MNYHVTTIGYAVSSGWTHDEPTRFGGGFHAEDPFAGPESAVAPGNYVRRLMALGHSAEEATRAWARGDTRGL